MAEMPSIGLNLRVTTDSKQGGRKYMEDVLSVKFEKGSESKGIEFAYFAVFDGHGGAEAGLFAKEHLLSEITKLKGFWSEDDDQVLKAIKDGFINTHKLMWKSLSTWPKTVSGQPSTSGTTASVVFIRNGCMYVGHVGDSGVVLGTEEKWLPYMKANCITVDHKPDSPKELRRIEYNGGAVIPKAGVNRVVWHRPKIYHRGPVRRSTPIDKIPFLAVARSLGDLWSYNWQRDVFVVSPEPDVSAYKLDIRRHKCLILASDGLWNMVKPHEAIDVVQDIEHDLEDRPCEYKSMSRKPAAMLVKLALDRWAARNIRADNTSVIVVMLDPPGPPKSQLCRTPSVSSTNTVMLASSDSEVDTLSTDGSNSADCDIEFDEGDTDDSATFGPQVFKTSSKLFSSKPLDASTTTGHPLKSWPVRTLTSSWPSRLSTLAHKYQHHRMPRLKLKKMSRNYPGCTTRPTVPLTASTQPVKTGCNNHTTVSSGNILMEAALNAPPFIEPITKVAPLSPLTPQKNGQMTPEGAGVEVCSPSRTLRSRSPRQVGGNLTNSSGTTPRSVRQRFSLSPSSSFMSSGLCSPLEATSPKSPLKVDTTSKNGSLLKASVSPLWPNTLDLGMEVEVDTDSMVGAAKVSKDESSAESGSTPDEARQHVLQPQPQQRESEPSEASCENSEHLPLLYVGSRQAVKRRASSTPPASNKQRHLSLTTRARRGNSLSSTTHMTRGKVKTLTSPPKNK